MTDIQSLNQMSNEMDVLYNNITSNQAAGLNEYEKSIFLTKAQNELIKNLFQKESKGNTVQKGFDDTPIRQTDFKNLIKSVETEASGTPVIDPRALVFKLPDDVFVIINEQIFLYNGKLAGTYMVSDGKWVLAPDATDTKGVPLNVIGTVDDYTKLPNIKDATGSYKVSNTIKGGVEGMRQVVPIAYTEYTRLMSKPFKEPLKYQAWRLISNTNDADTNIEIVCTSADRKAYNIEDYVVRYVKKPRPIILTNLSDAFGENLSIEGKTEASSCELDPSLHEAIVQRAVELAKIAWEGDVNQEQLHMTAGQRSE